MDVELPACKRAIPPTAGKSIVRHRLQHKQGKPVLKGRLSLLRLHSSEQGSDRRRQLPSTANCSSPPKILPTFKRPVPQAVTLICIRVPETGTVTPLHPSVRCPAADRLTDRARVVVCTQEICHKLLPTSRSRHREAAQRATWLKLFSIQFRTGSSLRSV